MELSRFPGGFWRKFRPQQKFRYLPDQTLATALFGPTPINRPPHHSLGFAGAFWTLTSPTSFCSHLSLTLLEIQVHFESPISNPSLRSIIPTLSTYSPSKQSLLHLLLLEICSPRLARCHPRAPKIVVSLGKFVKVVIHLRKERNQARRRRKPSLTLVVTWGGLGLRETRLFVSSSTET